MPVREEESWSTPRPQKTTGMMRDHTTEQNLMYEGCSQRAHKTLDLVKRILVSGTCGSGDSIEREVTI